MYYNDRVRPGGVHIRWIRLCISGQRGTDCTPNASPCPSRPGRSERAGSINCTRHQCLVSPPPRVGKVKDGDPTRTHSTKAKRHPKPNTPCHRLAECPRPFELPPSRHSGHRNSSAAQRFSRLTGLSDSTQQLKTPHSFRPCIRISIFLFNTKNTFIKHGREKT